MSDVLGGDGAARVGSGKRAASTSACGDTNDGAGAGGGGIVGAKDGASLTGATAAATTTGGGAGAGAGDEADSRDGDRVIVLFLAPVAAVVDVFVDGNALPDADDDRRCNGGDA